MTAVSVVVPTRNRSRLLATTLRSVLWQRDVDVEVFVVDEASTDDTAAVIAGFADRRVTTVRHATPQGLSVARNSGASRGSGQWLAFVDDDDVWAPDKLGRQIRAAEDAGRDWAYGGAVNVAGDLQAFAGSPPPAAEQVMSALPGYNPVPGGGSNVILRRQLWDEVGGFDRRFSACADWELWIRLARSGPPAAVAEPLVGYRVHSGNMSLDVHRIRHEARLIQRLHAASVDWGRLHRWLAESCLRTESHRQALGQFALAAVRGQARGVGADLAAILLRRVGRLGVRDPASEWCERARPWLEALQACREEEGSR